MAVLLAKVQDESTVKGQLEQLTRQTREHKYEVTREYGPFLVEMAKSTYKYLREKNSVLIAGLKSVSNEPASIADFCCGNGNGTARIAQAYPRAQVYGFDVMPASIKKAKRKNATHPNLHFKTADMYDFQDSRVFDIVTFHAACGTLADKVMQVGMEHQALVIAGKFCCYHTISDQTPASRDPFQNMYLRWEKVLHNFVRRRLAPNYVSPQTPMDLLSDFAAHELGLTESELRKIAGTAVDAEAGATIVDLNRVMKLMEGGYEVGYDGDNHIVVARKKEHTTIAIL